MSARRPSAATQDFSSVIFGYKYLSAPLCLATYNNLLNDSSQISDILTDDDTSFKLLSNFEIYANRIARFFTIVKDHLTDTARRHQSTVAESVLRKKIVDQFLLSLFGDVFKQFHYQSAFLDLIASIIQFNVSFYSGALNPLAQRLGEKSELLGLLISGEVTSSAMKDWIATFRSNITNPKVFESWTSTFITLCKTCENNHGVSQQINKWHDLRELREHLKAAQEQLRNGAEFQKSSHHISLNMMSKFGDDDRNSERATHEPITNINLSKNDLIHLKAFNITPPSSERRLILVIEKLDNDETLSIMKNLADTFPCKLCNEARESHALKNSSLSHTEMDQPLQFSELFGRRLGIWRVHLSARALKDFEGSSYEGNFEHIIKKLTQLASGDWKYKSLVHAAGNNIQRQRAQGTLHEAVYGSNGRILWQVDIEFDEDTNSVTQVVKVWRIGDHKEMDKAINSVLHIQKNYSVSRMEACKQTKLEKSSGRNLPIEFTDHAVLKLEQKASVESMEFNSEDEKAFESILLSNKFYALTDTVVDNLVSKNTNGEYPLIVSEEELRVIKNFKTSTLVLGRSGTGKTTCLVYKLLSRYLTTSEIQQGKPPRQVLLTRSPYLARKLGLQMRRLICSQRKNPIKEIEVDQWAILDDYDKEVIDTIVSLNDEDFPLVCTFDHFLKLLENTIRYGDRKNFSFRNRHLSNGKYDYQIPDSNEYRGVERSRFHLRKSRKVDFQVFRNEYWCTFPQNLTHKFPVDLAFKEIMGVIKGSASAETQFKPLSREEYITKSFRLAPAFTSQSERDRLYDIYEKYESKKRELQALDNIDRVISIFQAISDNEDLKQKVEDALEEIYVDEIQDQRLLEIELLINLVRNPRGIHFAGDTAQCISKDSTFRFQDVKALLFRRFSRISKIASARELARPELIKLRKNFRAHQGILSFSSFIMELLWAEFPTMVDYLPREIGEYLGPRPTIFANSGSFFTSILQSVELRPHMYTSALSAEQVIIVREREDKEKLSDDIGPNQKFLILTILESKGMEFDDVFLVDFFTTSECLSNFRALARSENIEGLKNVALCSELKQLYVAITRPRSRLWLFESDPSSINSIFELSERDKHQPLVEVVRLDDTNVGEKIRTIAQQMCRGKTSDPREWSKRGREFLHRQDYNNAMFCFENANDFRGMVIARAFIEEQKGRTYQALGNEAEFQKSLHEAAKLFHESELPFKEATCFESLGEFLEAAEIFLAQGEYEKAASLFEQAERYEEASNNYIRAGNYEEGAGALRRGSLFNKLVRYLNKYRDSINSNTHSHYSKICYLLLKQGKISYPESMTVEALGSDSKNGEMENVWSFVEYHDLRREIPQTELAEIFNYVQARSLNLRLSSELKTILIGNEKWYPKDSLIPEISAMRCLWQQLACVINDCQDRVIDFESISFEENWIKDFFSIIVTIKATRFIDAAKKMSELPIEFVNKVTDMIKLLATEGKFAPSLLFFLGIFPVSKKAGTYRLLDWSPLNSGFGDATRNFNTDNIMYKACKWALDHLHPAITQIHNKALELQRIQYPRRCHLYLTTMSCRKSQTEGCEYSHGLITQEEFANSIKDLLRMSSIYSTFTPLYHRYGKQTDILDQEFAKSFMGHRRVWIERLTAQITFFSSFEQDAGILTKTLHDISCESSEFFGVLEVLENLLFYRIRNEMKQRHNFSYLLEQLQLAETLGVGDKFMKCLTIAFRDPPSYPTKGHAYHTLNEVQNLRYEKFPGSSEIREHYETVLWTLEQFPIEDLPSFHAIIAFYEKLATFLIYMSRPTDFLIPNSWVQMYLLQMPGLFTKECQVGQPGMSPVGIQQVKSLDSDAISQYRYRQLLSSAVESFCILISFILDHDGALTTVPAGSRYPKPWQYLARRQIDFLAVTMANLRSMSTLLSILSEDITRVWNTVQTIVARLSVNVCDWGRLTPQMLATKLLEMFKQYNEKDFLLIITLGGRNSRAFPGLHKLGVPTVSMDSIWLSRLQRASASVPANNVESQLNSGHSEKEKKAAKIIQNFWRIRYPKVRQRREFLASSTGKAHVFIQKLRGKILKKDLRPRERLERTILLVRDGTELYLRVKGLENWFLEIRKVSKDELWNEALTAKQIESLQNLWEELPKIRRTVRKEVTIYTEKNEEWLDWSLWDLKVNYEKTKVFLDDVEAELNRRKSELKEIGAGGNSQNGGVRGHL